MNDNATDLDRADEDSIITCDVSDEALEAAAAAAGTAMAHRTMLTFVDKPGCGGTC